jgi:predicted PurR-regulated permease PerM
LIPLFGPILAAIPAIAIALLSGGATLGVITLCIYIVIQQFESQLIQPLVVKKIVGIPVLVSIFAIIIGAKVAGFIGILISVPVAAVLMELLSDMEKAKLAANSKD